MSVGHADVSWMSPLVATDIFNLVGFELGALRARRVTYAKSELICAQRKLSRG